MSEEKMTMRILPIITWCVEYEWEKDGGEWVPLHKEIRPL